MIEGIAWVEGRPETARRFSGWLHEQWVRFALGIGTFWPNPWRARRVWAFRASKGWIRNPSNTAQQWERLLRERKAWTR